MNGEERIGQMIKSDHPYAYRSGQWGEVIGVSQINSRPCWVVQWEPDYDLDHWPQDDKHAAYQFKEKDER